VSDTALMSCKVTMMEGELGQETQRVCRILESVIGIPFEPDSLLRALVPNSLMLVQAILALEGELGVSVDMASLDYDATVADLAAALTAEVDAVPADPGSDEIALSPIQTAYLLGSEDDIELGGQATFIYAEASYDCSADRLASAVEAVLDRHDVFDYEIDLERGVMRPGSRQVGIGLSDDSSPEALLRMRRDLRHRARKSNEQGPLAYVEVCGAGPCKLLGYFNMVIMDAGSLYTLFKEIEAVLEGKSLPDAMPLAQAVSKALGRNSDEKKERDLAYWREKVGAFPTMPESAQRVMGTSDWHTVRLSEALDAPLVSDLDEAADNAGASLSALILACCSAVVARWQNAPGMVCNVTVSHRSALGLQSSVIGDFTSSMLVGVDVGSARTVSALAATVSQDMFNGLAHGSVGGVEVMADMMRSGADQQTATAPIVFTSYLGGEQGIDIALDFVYTQTAQVCLDMQVMPASDGRINVSWDVVPEYYPHAEDMFGRLLDLLREVASGQDALPLKDGTTEQMVQRYNDTAAPKTETTLLDFVERSVLKSPHRKAIVGAVEYTYQNLWERSGRLADYLRKRGVQPRDKVIIEFTKHPDDVVAMVAALRVGAAYVPVAASLPEARREAIRDSIPGSVVVTTDTAHREGSDARRSMDGLVRPDADDLAYLIFTSGSTGTPKGVEITHRGAVGTILDINERYGVDAQARIIGLSSLGFDLSVYDAFGAFAAGGTLAMVGDERDADEILEVLGRERITLWNSAPAVMELVLLRCERGTVFDSVKTVMLSGDRIPASQPKRIMEVFPHARVYSLGGATEASIWSIQYPLEADSLAKRIPYGYPLSNQGIHVLSYDRIACPRGVIGQIWISGDGVAEGYASEPGLTAAAFQEIPGLGRCYKTGDLGIFNHEGFVEFCGREDRQVKVAGFRVELGEIESVLARSGLVVTSAALAIDRKGRQVLMCAYVPNGEVAMEDVRDELAGHLPAYMVPQLLLPVKEMPMTANGKLDQKALVARIGHEGRPAEAEAVQASQANIELMREVFEFALGCSVNNLQASFFSLGGDSLSFQIMLREASRRTGRRLRFRDVLKNPSVQAAAGLLEHAQGAEQGVRATLPVTNVSADPSSDHAPFPLTEMQMAYYVGRHQGFDLGGVGEHYYIESIIDTDILQLEQALNAVIRRHDMLRAIFTCDGQQKILPEVPHYRIEVEDLSSARAGGVAAAVRRKRDELSHQRFDLQSWPLFHLSALALPDGTHRLFFSVDMIIGDGASQRIFVRDLSRACAGEALSKMPGSYRNYVLAVREQQAKRDALPLSAQTERLLDEFPLGNVLPQRGIMADVPHMSRLSWSTSERLTLDLEARAREHGVSLSTALLAAYAKSLALFSREGKVGINVTTYNRDLDVPGAQDMFGDFTGIVLVDYDDSSDENALELIQARLLEQVGEGRSGVKLLAEMSRRRGFSGRALAPFVFTSLLFGQQSTVTSALGKIDYAISQTPQVLVDNQVMLVDGALSISWDFVDCVLDPALVEAIFGFFKSSLESFADGGMLESALPLKSVRLMRDAWADARVVVADEEPQVSETMGFSESQVIVAEKVQECLASDFSIEDAVDPDASLFDIGLDSLGFVQLVQRVQTAAGRQLPLAEALASPTIRTLVHLVTRDDDAGSALGENAVDEGSLSLVLLRDGSSRSVVVMVHGGFGTVDIYQDLALGMPKEAQVWGVQFAGFAKQWPQNLSVSHIASRYAQDIEHVVDPDARIVVVGWSVGGTLGHALAVKLGNRCAGLVLLDSLAPGVQTEVGRFDVRSDMAVLRRAGVECAPAGTLEELWSGQADDPDAVRRIASAFSGALLENLGVSAGQVRVVDLSTLRTLIAARNGYQPQICQDISPGADGSNGAALLPALVVLPDDGKAYNALEWEIYLGRIQRETVRGNHYSFITGPECEPAVTAVANFVNRIFDER
jgi:amino acid adenylation domain-containing protein